MEGHFKALEHNRISPLCKVQADIESALKVYSGTKESCLLWSDFIPQQDYVLALRLCHPDFIYDSSVPKALATMNMAHLMQVLPSAAVQQETTQPTSITAESSQVNQLLDDRLQAKENQLGKLKIQHSTLEAVTELNALKAERNALKTETELHELQTELNELQTEHNELQLEHNALKREMEHNTLKTETELNALKTEMELKASKTETELDALRTALNTALDAVKGEHLAKVLENDSRYARQSDELAELRQQLRDFADPNW